MAGATFIYCPLCATPLVERQIHETMRLACPSCSFIHYLEPKVVTVVVVQFGETFLLGQRNIDPAKGQWSFISGYMDRGEKVEEAAVREVKEETDLDVYLEELIGIYSERGDAHVVIAYRARMLDNDIDAMTAQPDEVSQLAFFSLDEMPPLAFPSDQAILTDLRLRSRLESTHDDYC